MAVSSAAFAQTATATLNVTAIVGDVCNIATSAVAFGAYDPLVVNLTAPLNGTGTVSTTCASGLANTITLDQGVNAAGGSTAAVPLRQLKSGTAMLGYFLYQNNTRTTVWGNTPASGFSETGTGLNTITTVYGQIPGGVNAPAGAYADTVTATVTF